MLRRATLLLAIVFGLSFNSLSYAASPFSGTPGNSPIVTPKISEAPFRDRFLSDSWLEELLEQSEFYEFLLQHPNFIKVQGIITTFWKRQTFGKRRYSSAYGKNRLLIQIK